MEKRGMHPCGHHTKLQHHAMRIAPYGLIAFVLILVLLLLALSSSSSHVRTLSDNLAATQDKLDSLGRDYTDMQTQYSRLKQNYRDTMQQYSTTKDAAAQTQEDLRKAMENLRVALMPPYISIINQSVYMVFRRSDGTMIEWLSPWSALNNDLQRGYFRREYVDNQLIPLHSQYANIALNVATTSINDQMALCTRYQGLSDSCDGGSVGCDVLYATLLAHRASTEDDFLHKLSSLHQNGKEYRAFTFNGKSIKVMDFKPYVDASTFSAIIPSLYYQIGDEEKFIREVWYIVAQLTVYSSEIEETPKYPLETLLSGGGDCEDTAILVASMLKAVPEHWTVSLVYMDSDHPDNPQTLNHVIVSVKTAQGEYLIETTSKHIMNPYTSVQGLYLDV